MAFDFAEDSPKAAVIRVIGVGGGGGNAVEHMMRSSVQGVEFIAANTDAQHLQKLSVPTKLQLGLTTTKGLGAGAQPNVGRAAAQEDREKISELISGADMVFITAGMGGGTGTGAAPVIAEVARELDVLSVAVVTRPFFHEGRTSIAEDGITELGQHVDSLIAVPNDKLLEVLGKKAKLSVALATANNVLRDAVQGIADIIMRPGIINVDFADVRTVMGERGLAIMGTGEAEGENRAAEATDRAMHNPLLAGVSMQGARGVVVNVTASEDIHITEFMEVGEIVRNLTAEDATVVLGTVQDEALGERMRVTVVGTGLGAVPAQGATARKPVLTPVQRQARPDSAGDSAAGVARTPAAGPGRMGRSRGGREGDLDDRGLGVARSLRQQADGPVDPNDSADDMGFLDIPSFLRRQAD